MNLVEYFKRHHPSPVRMTRLEERAVVIPDFVPRFVSPRVRRVIVLKVLILIAFAFAAVAPLKYAVLLSIVANAYWLFFIKE